jgi:hypothetical protein
VVSRGPGAKEQAAEQTWLAGGDCDEGCGPVDVLVEGGAETWVAGHGAEPVLDLSRQVEKAGRVLLGGEPDDHLNSLAERGPPQAIRGGRPRSR